jgi:hypothetical protein
MLRIPIPQPITGLGVGIFLEGVSMPTDSVAIGHLLD